MFATPSFRANWQVDFFSQEVKFTLRSKLGDWLSVGIANQPLIVRKGFVICLPTNLSFLCCLFKFLSQNNEVHFVWCLCLLVSLLCYRNALDLSVLFRDLLLQIPSDGQYIVITEKTGSSLGFLSFHGPLFSLSTKAECNWVLLLIGVVTLAGSGRFNHCLFECQWCASPGQVLYWIQLAFILSHLVCFVGFFDGHSDIYCCGYGELLAVMQYGSQSSAMSCSFHLVLVNFIRYKPMSMNAQICNWTCLRGKHHLHWPRFSLPVQLTIFALGRSCSIQVLVLLHATPDWC